MATAFSICALVQTWRQYIPTGQTEQTAVGLPDPHWLVAINALSLAAALIGNLALLLNMASRLRFTIAQPGKSVTDLTAATCWQGVLSGSADIFCYSHDRRLRICLYLTNCRHGSPDVWRKLSYNLRACYS